MNKQHISIDTNMVIIAISECRTLCLLQEKRRNLDNFSIIIDKKFEIAYNYAKNIKFSV